MSKNLFVMRMVGIKEMSGFVVDNEEVMSENRLGSKPLRLFSLIFTFPFSLTVLHNFILITNLLTKCN